MVMGTCVQPNTDRSPRALTTQFNPQGFSASAVQALGGQSEGAVVQGRDVNSFRRTPKHVPVGTPSASCTGLLRQP